MITLEDLIEECASETDIVEKLRKLDTNSRDRLIMIINDNNVVGTAKFLSILPNRKLEITKLLMS